MRLKKNIRRQLYDFKISAEKGASGSMELHEQIDQVQRLKNRAEKERIALQRQLEMAQSQLDDESKQRLDLERRGKTSEGQLLELRLKTDEQARQLQASSGT